MANSDGRPRSLPEASSANINDLGGCLSFDDRDLLSCLQDLVKFQTSLRDSSIPSELSPSRNVTENHHQITVDGNLAAATEWILPGRCSLGRAITQ